jgi:APA family basic amino acid/polyamine antiporter
LYTFIILLSTAGVIVLYFVGALAAWKLNSRIGPRAVIAIALLFAVYALYGTGMEADLWCLMLLATGFVVRAFTRWLSGSSREVAAIPAAPPGSSS